MGVLQDEGAGGDAEGGVEALVGVGDLDGRCVGRAVRFKGEGELLVDGKVILVGQVDGGVRRVMFLLSRVTEGRAGRR